MVVYSYIGQRLNKRQEKYMKGCNINKQENYEQETRQYLYIAFHKLEDKKTPKQTARQ